MLVGLGAFALLLWEPHLVGRDANATVFEIYFKDPVLAYLWSIQFFVELYQELRVRGYAGLNKVFSQTAVKALRTIKYCAIALVSFVAVREIFIQMNNSDDRADGVFIGILIAFGTAFFSHPHTSIARRDGCGTDGVAVFRAVYCFSCLMSP